MAFSVPAAPGLKKEDLQQSMSSPKAKAALEDTIATALGVQPKAVTVTQVDVTQGGSGRRLQASAKALKISVKYIVTLESEEAAAGKTVETLSQQMTEFSNPKSEEKARFDQALGSNLKKVSSGNSAPIAAPIERLAEIVEVNGVEVQEVESPEVVVVHRSGGSRDRIAIVTDASRRSVHGPLAFIALLTTYFLAS